ncbi:MAG: ATP-binding protein [Candidatus Thiodiazotropha sp. (ex Dulcina madagascariensis)]|nr:ATP-binding protein [Candidatus Thiodiazotropha sp. (ex Dulcina madagascariensis)]
MLLALYGKKATQGCPCGHLGDGSQRCNCTIEQITRYRNRISGPLLDRIDMHVEVPRQPIRIGRRHDQRTEESSDTIRKRVILAREFQLERQGKTNQALEGEEIERYIQLDSASIKLLHRAIDQLGLSMRAYHRIIKVARTVADLETCPNIETRHVSEAIGYRRLDRS